MGLWKDKAVIAGIRRLAFGEYKFTGIGGEK